MHTPRDYMYLHFLSSFSLVVKRRASCFQGIHFTKWTDSQVPKKRFKFPPTLLSFFLLLIESLVAEADLESASVAKDNWNN